MASKNILTDGKNLGIAGGIISIISVFLPWYSASASAGMLGLSSSISVNGLGWKSGEGMLLGIVSGTANWEFQGIGVLALGIASILVTGYSLYCWAVRWLQLGGFLPGRIKIIESHQINLLLTCA